jgi:hypothetical protein
MPIPGVPFTVYTLTATDVVGGVTVTTYDNRPTNADRSGVVLETEAIVLPDGRTRLLGAVVEVQSAPLPSDTAMLSDFRVTLGDGSGEDTPAQLAFDRMAAFLP